MFLTKRQSSFCKGKRASLHRLKPKALKQQPLHKAQLSSCSHTPPGEPKEKPPELPPAQVSSSWSWSHIIPKPSREATINRWSTVAQLHKAAYRPNLIPCIAPHQPAPKASSCLKTPQRLLHNLRYLLRYSGAIINFIIFRGYAQTNTGTNQKPIFKFWERTKRAAAQSLTAEIIWNQHVQLLNHLPKLIFALNTVAKRKRRQ